QRAVLDELRAPGRQPLARDALGAHQAATGAVVEQAQKGGGDRLAELAEERRARRVERAGRARRDHDVVQEIGHRLAAEDHGVGSRWYALAVDGVDPLLP